MIAALKQEARAHLPLSPTLYQCAHPMPEFVDLIDLEVPAEQRVLRMMFMDGSNYKQIMLPAELAWVRPMIDLALFKQLRSGMPLHQFGYVTIRSGVATGQTDDVWHVDGFSMRKPHLPEQNYIWADAYPTEWLDQQVALPPDFNPLRHNIHHYFQDHADEKNRRELVTKAVYRIDPYNVHRRSPMATGKRRCFVRVSFVPIEIEDDKNTPNPLLPRPKFNNVDIRTTMTRYPG